MGIFEAALSDRHRKVPRRVTGRSQGFSNGSVFC